LLIEHSAFIFDRISDYVLTRGIHEQIIGIDLGTTNSVVAVMEGGEPVVITNLKAGV